MEIQSFLVPAVKQKTKQTTNKKTAIMQNGLNRTQK
jgi:hypothetical protein